MSEFLNKQKGASKVKKRHKKSNQDTTAKVVLVTAIINLIFKLIELIEKLLD